MHKITDEEVEFILNDITKKGIVTEDVKYNILDHVCCIIENELQIGMDFNEFYKDTIARFYSKELQEIEDETQLLITFKYYHAMKRTVKITGLVAILMILVGSFLKVQHWPGASMALVLGFAIFSFIFIPLNIIMKFRDDKEKYNRLVMTLGLTLVLTGTIGLLFKVMHWPFANYLFFGSLAIFGLVFIPIYFFTNYRRPETKFNAIIHTTFMIAAAGMLFTLINLRSSHATEESEESARNFQLSTLDQYAKKNDLLYSQVESESKVEDLRVSTDAILNLIGDIKANLVSKSNNVSFEQAHKLSINDLKLPNDHNVVKNNFIDAKGDFSYQNLTEAMEVYNQKIASIDNESLLFKVDLSALDMSNAQLALTLTNLMAIEAIILSNENAFLCYSKGLTAQK